jgi:thiamine-phosphate diphosphorylase
MIVGMDRPILHVLTDPGLSRGRSHVDVAFAALRGGADVIQLRDKTAPWDAQLAVARRLRDLVTGAGRVLVVNDDLELAKAAEADGIHLGPEDLPVAHARSLWPRPRILGASARTIERARELVAAGADYLGVGPVFGTTTKRDAPCAIGLTTLAEIVRAVSVPVIAIGGVCARNAALAIGAGASGVAVISAVVSAEDVEAATAELRDALDEAFEG